MPTLGLRGLLRSFGWGGSRGGSRRDTWRALRDISALGNWQGCFFAMKESRNRPDTATCSGARGARGLRGWCPRARVGAKNSSHTRFLLLSLTMACLMGGVDSPWLENQSSADKLSLWRRITPQGLAGWREGEQGRQAAALGMECREGSNLAFDGLASSTKGV